MKRIRYFVALGGVLLLFLAVLLLVTCQGDRHAEGSGGTDTAETTEKPSSETGGTEGDATLAPRPDSEQTEVGTETPTPHQTQPESETEIQPASPVPLTAEEVRVLLSAALGKGVEQASVTVQARRNGEVVSQRSFLQKGQDFSVELRGDGITEGVTAVGDRAYYILLMPKEFPPVENKLVMSLTDREREALHTRFAGEISLPVMGDGELIGAILNGSLEGVRHSDGTVELTSRGLDGGLGESLFGTSPEGAELAFDFLLDKEVRVTFLRGTVSYSAEGEGSVASLSVEMTVSYTHGFITLPANATDYAPTTYDQVFGVRPPEVDPDAAAEAGLSLDKEHYTLIGGNYLYDPSESYEFLTRYPHAYVGKTFTLYGILTGDGSGQAVLSLGSGMDIPVSLEGVSVPVEGSYVKITATYRRVTEGESFLAYAMRVTACEVLGEAKGPNGGRLLYVASAGLNVRSTPDASGSDNVIGTYSKGDLVEVFEQDGEGWYRVVCNGQTGYVNGKYLSETRP